MRVLQGDHVHHVDVVGIRKEGVGDVLGRQLSAFGTDRSEGDPGHRGRRGPLHAVHVSRRLAHHQVSRPAQDVQGDLVGHGAGHHVDRGVLSRDLGAPLLEPVDRRIVPIPVVADLGCGHGLAHGIVGPGDGVRAKVDRPAHGGRV